VQILCLVVMPNCVILLRFSYCIWRINDDDISKTRCPNFNKFRLRVATARSSSDDNTICCVLPVLQTLNVLHTGNESI